VLAFFMGIMSLNQRFKRNWAHKKRKGRALAFNLNAGPPLGISEANPQSTIPIL